MIEFKMPSLGADMEDGTLVEWRKKPGDLINRGDIIADVDTQKGLIEIEVFEEGIIERLLLEEGVKVPVGTLMAVLRPLDGETEDKDTSSVISPEEPEIREEAAVKPSIEKEERRVKITPLAKRIAQENKVDFSVIEGTGPEGAIVKKDIEKTMAGSAVPSKEVVRPDEQAKAASPTIKKELRTPSTKAIRTAVAAAMSKSNREIPHYFLEKKINMSNAMSWLKEINSHRPVQKRLLAAALLIKSVAASLDEVPDLNGVWEDELVIKNEINIGFVVSLRAGGIVVPSLKNADLKSVDEIMEWLNDVIPRARSFNLRSSELSDSTVTISSLGEGGADKVFGIIYPPQVAIIGFGNIIEEPVAQDGMIGIHPMLFVTLSGDHRATDGMIGSRFLTALNKHLQTPEKLGRV
ncbi:dihydrolipoamide acetyltransferase family protein [Cyclobacterium jeungdonense]|uniref:Dihydrolipoamide acetyltransferase component of pyruvate dehydrogenase complex n=1 Tax=Cyclobacterium jeungdonense TaxID=708087 RepID=A0ABT8CCC6_9BACT|nr:dihydrolipoamide acetyltransferase family protein [Cyclobacterium jeungdonense]MDN3690161.1 dihydrolipoamide acetyltransferase family protein [Cyclobacterium jeungdonense]